MEIRLKWLATITALLMLVAMISLGGIACDDSDDGGNASSVEDDDEIPPENYIPLNDEACVIESQTDAIIEEADNKINEVIDRYTTLVGEGLELCDPEPQNGCPACALEDNQVLALARDTDDLVQEFMEASGLPWSADLNLAEYFRRALLYPYRYILTSYLVRKNKSYVVLTQGKSQPCANEEECNHFSIESESLDVDCKSFPMSLYGTGTASRDGSASLSASLREEALDLVTMGFVVPLTLELPDDPYNISEAELDAWLQELENLENRMDARIEEPTVDMNIDSTGGGCATISGYLDKSTFDNYARGEALAATFFDMILPDYESEDRPGKISVILSMRLEPGTFVSGIGCTPSPCQDADDSTCSDQVMTAYAPQAACRLPRPDNYDSGDAIEPVCEYATPITYTVDCTDLGGECVDGACSETWGSPEAGDLAFTEVMNRPNTDRTYSVWFELTNVGEEAIDLAGCYLQGRPGKVGEKQTIPATVPFVVGPGQAITFVNSADTSINGGVNADIVSNGDIQINGLAGDDPDYLAIYCANRLMDEITWDWEDNGMEYGSSLQLDSGKYSPYMNDTVDDWCNSTTTYGAGGNGTPGATNATCP